MGTSANGSRIGHGMNMPSYTGGRCSNDCPFVIQKEIEWRTNYSGGKWNGPMCSLFQDHIGTKVTQDDLLEHDSDGIYRCDECMLRFQEDHPRGLKTEFRLARELVHGLSPRLEEEGHSVDAGGVRGLAEDLLLIQERVFGL